MDEFRLALGLTLLVVLGAILAGWIIGILYGS
jgi:hypothetical protein